MRKTISAALLCGSMICSLRMQAQEKESELDPVTVTSSLRPEKTSITGRNVLVIKGDRFFDLPVHSVDDLLRYLPGIEVQARGPMGSQSDIVLRGGTFQQVLVVMDGLRLNDPNTGHFTGYFPISPSEIDRIEILKGAGSAIYGSEAVGGVINIITKTFAAQDRPQKTSAIVQATGGAYGLAGIQAGGLLQQSNTTVSAGIASNNADGQPQRGTTGYFHNNTFTAAINEKLGAWNLAFRTAYDSRRFSAQNFYTTFLSDTAFEKVTTLWNQLQLSYVKADDKITVDLGYKEVKDRYTFNSGVTPNQNTSDLLQGLLVYEHTLNSVSSFSAGTQVLTNKIQSNDRGNHTTGQAAAFLVFHQSAGKRFFFEPSVRLDWNQLAGTELVPQLNASYRTDHVQLRASAGKTIREADFTEQYNNYNKARVTSGSIGNPNLQAERSFSYEAGADYYLSHFKLSATVFRREQSNVIDFVNTPYSEMPRKDNLVSTGTYALAKNIAQLNTTGAEADLQYVATAGKDRSVWATLGITWLDDESPAPITSFYISSHAKFLSNLSLAYKAPWYSVELTRIYKTRMAQAASGINASVSSQYFLTNLRLESKKFGNKASLFAEADNLFNTSYSDLLGAPMPGRWIMGGIRITLSK